ncbi:hypothetical protein BD779DRAFT_1682328 [Infundibulicybe gibba]|nr:hypothetical protein BD779DRAFT_1682328 [Infundibulicybe gibba]
MTSDQVIALLVDNNIEIFSNIYFSAFSITSTIWDHIITFDDEAKYIWNGDHPRLTKAAFILNRAVAAFPFRLLSSAIGIVGSRSLVEDLSEIVRKPLPRNFGLRFAEYEDSCRAFVWTFSILNTSIIATTQCLISFRIYQLWERKRIIAQLLFIISIIFVPGTLTMAIISAKVTADSIIVIPGLQFCALTSRSPLIAISLGAMALFDFLLVSLMVLNAMSCPRREDSDMIFMLHRDGALSFIAIFVIRLLGVFLTAFAASGNSYVLVTLTCALSAIVNSRLIIRIAEVKYEEDLKVLNRYSHVTF